MRRSDMQAQNTHEMENVFLPSSHRVKDLEKENVFRLIQKGKSISQKEILDVYKIRPADLSGAIKELLADRMIVRDSALEEQGRGRPKVFFRVNPQRLCCFALYVDSWTVRAALIDMEGNTLHTCHRSVGSDASAEEILDTQADLLEELKDSVRMGTEILGVGISVPGSVDAQRLVWKESQRWRHIREIDYAAFQERIGLSVMLHRDLDAAMLGELSAMPSLRDELVVLLHWGIGLGISFAYRGQIVRSNHGRFGTIGYTQFNPYSVDHMSDNNIERHTSLRNLIHAIRYKHPTAKLDEREIAELVAGDSLQDIPDLQMAIDHVGLALRNLCAILYPDKVLLLSPFAENEALVKKLQHSFALGRLIDDVQAKIPLIPIRNGYAGCAVGSTLALFEKGFETYLRARY